MRGFWSGLAIAICLAAITAGGIVITTDDAPAAPGTAANAFVADVTQTCTRSATPITYATAKSNGWVCGSFAAAEAVDSPGDLVVGRCDTASSCTIQSAGDSLSSSNASFITYREEDGYTVQVGSWSRGTGADTLAISGDKIIVEGFTVPHLDVSSASVDVVARGLDGSSFDVSGDNVAIIDGDWSYEPCSPVNTSVTAQGTYFTSNTDSVVRGNWFHDNDSTGCSTSSGALHTDCLQYHGASSTTIERNKFGPHCGAGDDIIFGDNGTTLMDNIVVVNNAFVQNQEDAGFDQAVDVNFSQSDVSGNCHGTTYFRFNTIAPERKGYPSEDTSCDGISDNYGNIVNQVISGGDGEVGDWTMIMSGVTTGAGTGSFLATPNHNPGGSCNFTNCGPLQAHLDAQFVNDIINGDTDADTNTHLIAGSDAINAFGGTASLCPHSDIDGHLRSGNCDIGADEYDSAGNGDAPDWYVDDAGSDSNLCTFVLPCLTMERAYSLAAAGDVVGLLSGTYANQTIDVADFAKNSDTDVVFQPAPGASVTLGADSSPGLTINGSNHITVQDMTINEFAIVSGTDLTLDDIDAHVFTIEECTDCTVSNSDIGPYETYSQSGVEDTQIGGGFNSPSGCVSGNPTTGNGTTCTQDIVRLTLTGNFFHDYTDADDGDPGEPADPHLDCLQFFEGEDVVISGNTFDNDCGEANDVFIRGDAGPVDGFTIENNFSYRTIDSFSIRLSGNSCPGSPSACEPPCADVTIRNNTVRQEIGANCTVTNGTIRGNINLSTSSYICDSNDDDPQGKYGTEAGWVYSLNVVGNGGVECDASDINSADPTFVSSTTDLHLTGAAGVADDALPDPHAATDIDGAGRASTADIGADER